MGSTENGFSPFNILYKYIDEANPAPEPYKPFDYHTLGCQEVVGVSGDDSNLHMVINPFYIALVLISAPLANSFQNSSHACSCVDCEDACPAPPPAPPAPIPFVIFNTDGYTVVAGGVFLLGSLVIVFLAFLSNDGQEMIERESHYFNNSLTLTN
jgi:hypothetical protein